MIIMDSATMKVVAALLEGHYFKVAADLGCGYGDVAPLLKRHCYHLIGIDKNIERLTVSGFDILYDEKIKEDIRYYTIPSSVEAIFLFDVLEHLNPNDALNLLQKFGSRYCIVTTPLKYHYTALDGHASLWSETVLRNLGFNTATYSVSFVIDALYGGKIIAWR